MVSLPRMAEVWLPGYLRDRMRRIRQAPPQRISLVIADHFEPFWRHAAADLARARVALWVERWPGIADRIASAHSFLPKYTFFYPEEEYRPELIDMLVPMVEAGIADIEVHIHHDGEGEQNFVDRMSGFVETLARRHGLLRTFGARTVFGFIHGDWALDNSLPGGKCCGLNNEIQLLRRIGCYADFTLPPSRLEAQARIVNTIYWAVDNVKEPKSYATGTPFSRRSGVQGDLLMVPGPFGIRWAERLLPRIEHGELASYDPPTPYRCRRWTELAPRVDGEAIVKLYTHGAQERNSSLLLGGGLEDLFEMMAVEAKRCGSALRSATAFDVYRGLMGESVAPGGKLLSRQVQ